MAAERLPQTLLTLSMRGGVGKTTTAIGLAKALYRRGHNVAYTMWLFVKSARV